MNKFFGLTINLYIDELQGKTSNCSGTNYEAL